MSRKPYVTKGILVGAALLVVASCCRTPPPPRSASAPAPGVATPLVGDAGPSSLKVALYPYVPRLQQFKDVILSEWQKIEPGVSLEWADDWDGGYNMNPDPSYDVFVFDALNLGYFQANHFILPLQKSQVTNYADLVPFAQTGVTVNDTVLAIPQLGCGDFLFYYTKDSQIAAAKNATDLASALGSCTYFGEKPASSGEGLMVDLAGGTTVSSTYLEGVYELSGQFPSPLPTQIDSAVALPIQDVVGLSSFSDILYTNDSNGYQRAAWFSEGFGRAYVGFTESMSQIDPHKLSSISFKPMPWSTNSSGISAPLFYSDVVGVGPSTSSRGTTALAIQLANLMTSANVIVELFGPYQDAGPQYLMPVSESALRQLAGQFPMYEQMSHVLGTVNPRLFNLGADSKPWLGQVKSMMKSMVLAHAQCYCDLPSSQPIQDNNDAQTKCPTVCGSRGWNGQWTNVSTPSVCGCNGPCTTHHAKKVKATAKR